MSLNPSSSIATSKVNTNSSAQTTTYSQPQVNVNAGAEGSQRRSGGSGSFGAGSNTRNAHPSARNQQSLKKQHKSQRRPRLADEDTMAESAAMKSTTSRKGQTSITHLMNFSLPPRPQYNSRAYPSGRTSRRNPAWGLGSGYHAVDKARYVHANYRFVVNPKLDYRAQAVDADIHLDWAAVLQILASAQSQCSTCPICLSAPVAPRMAKCGHIFCLPCLIRYMHSTDETKPVPERRARWKKCPICWDSVYMSEVRPVRWFTGQENSPPREGEDVVLRLVMREPGSTLALPRDGAEALSSTEDIPWQFAAEVADYARVMKGTEDYMMTQFDQEMEQLQQLEREDELMYGDEPAWTRKAVNSIMEAKERTKGIGNPPTMPRDTAKKPVKRPPIEFHHDHDVPDMYMIHHAARSGSNSSGGASTPHSQSVASHPAGSTDTSSVSLLGEALAETHVHDKPKSQPNGSKANGETSPLAPSGSIQGKLQESRPQDSPYYFYQALLDYYLSPLDIRILKAAFGSFASFPTTILPRVERVSTGHVVDDELRKRARYLAHLPYGCEVGFLECDFTDVVAPEILETFKPELDKRRKKNKDKEVREEKERVRAEREEDDKRWASARRKRPSTSSHEPISQHYFEPLASGDAGAGTGAASSSVDASIISASPPWGSTSRHQNGSVFASLASPSTSPSAPRTVWGTAVVAAPNSPTMHAEPTEPIPGSDANDGWLQGWEKDLLQHDDDVLAQVQAASTVEPGAVQSGVGAAPVAAAAAGKKKKGKKITLMSTNARRGA